MLVGSARAADIQLSRTDEQRTAQRRDSQRLIGKPYRAASRGGVQLQGAVSASPRPLQQTCR